MHEWALAEAVISTVQKTAEKESLKEVTKIKLKIGELQQIDHEIFQFALKEIMKSQSELVKNASVEIETEKATLHCRVCGNEWSFDEARKKLSGDEAEAIHFLPEVSHSFVRCPRCDSPDFEFVQGRGVLIESIEGKRNGS